ncbi:unnamed protein product [Rhizophagus irregularis]|nr:unnamed protein product [Rhizophagus irregularis]
MSCSKIFSGDLPELLYEIIKYFRNDYSTLHSCILVNRLWCRLTIPLLWEDPFSILNGNYNFIEIYLYNLNDYLKTKLNEYQIIDNLLTPSSSSNNNTLFNYPNFIKYLNICKIIPCIEGWLESNERTSKFSNRYYIRYLIMESVSEFKRFINISIIKLFIENEVNLNTLEIEISITDYYNTCADNILEIILQNPNFIKNIKNLKFSILSSNKLIKNRILQIINSHQNLKRILLVNHQVDNIKLILQNLGQSLPIKLEYLKYIMKKERVKYLAIKNTFIIRYNRKNVDLSDLKDEVKEFKLYNIKVLNYNDLSTDIYRYINEID